MAYWTAFTTFCIFILTGVVTGADHQSICDITRVTDIIDSQKFSRDSIDDYQSLLPQISTYCHGKEWDQIINKINYNLGIIYLSIGQDHQAMKSFREVLLSNNTAYADLSLERLNELYKKYGEWDKVKEGESKLMQERFHQLIESITTHIGNAESSKLLNEQFEEAFKISPYAFKLRVLYNDFLLDQLADIIDLNVAHKAVENLQTLLDKFGNKIELNNRLALYDELATMQLFILNTQPQVTLRKCLNLDMDYQPCKYLMKVWNQISKNLPPPSKMIDIEDYMSYTTDWSRATNFLLDNKRSVIAKYGNNLKNYEILVKYHDEKIKQILESRPLSNKTWHYDSVDTHTDFLIYLNVVICEALDMQSSSKKASKYCYNAMKESLTPGEIEKLKAYFKKFESPNTLKELLTALYDTYPHLSINLLHSVSQKLTSLERKKSDINTVDHWAVLVKFVQDHKLSESPLNFIKNLANSVVRTYNSIQNHQKQQQQRIFEQMFGNQQQQQFHQYQQHQRQQQFVEPNIKTDKDYYKILGIEKGATTKDIRRSYLQLTKKFHPDKQKKMNQEEREKNEAKMAEINEAYEILSDEDKRKKYDDAKSSRGNVYGNQGFRSHGGHGGFNNFGKTGRFQRKKPNH